MNKSDLQAGVEVRLRAVKVLLAITRDHEHLDDALQRFNHGLTAQDAALLQAMSYGVMRWYFELQFWLELQANRPARKLKPAVRLLVMLGLLQLKYMRIPAHAAIHATVECAGHLRVARAKGLINAVLRGFQRRNADELLEQLEQASEEARYAHPGWILKRIKRDWPDEWSRVIEANNRQAPMVLRLDSRQTDASQYMELLNARDIEARPHNVAAEALVLAKPVDVSLLPGFDEGMVSVQDAAAQLAAPLLNVNSGHRVLDACAAPGGKTAHLMQLTTPVYLAALDNNAKRLQRLYEMLQRIGGNVDVLLGDASSTQEWWDGQLFDRILLDAPCSASGVIRRHPDIKFLRNEAALDKIVKRQTEIMDALWQLLKPGGMLLYVTCSIFKVENEQQVQAFLDRHADARLSAIAAPWGRGDVGKQLLPGDDDMDGFYFAPIMKSE